MDIPTHLWLGLTAAGAGAMNAVAGGGTLLTFPALLGALPAGDFSKTVANATSTIALMPGSLASAWGYRTELTNARALLPWLVAPCLVGGVLGALLVTRLPAAVFGALVPWLVLTAAVLFTAQPLIMRWLVRRKGKAVAGPEPAPAAETLLHGSAKTRWAIVGAQLLIALYGGYFGAGIGILMLSALSFMPLKDIHQANAVKTVLAALINVMSMAVFVLEDRVSEARVAWEAVPTMTVAAILGGYFGARVSRRLKPAYVRVVVAVIGFALAGFFFLRG